MRYIFALLILTTSFFTYGQHLNEHTVHINGEPIDSLSRFVIKMNKNEYFLASIPDSIHPKWIKKMAVLKKVDQQHLYGNGDVTVLIYPRKKYFKQIRLILEPISNDKAQIK